jgi:hypothetical protein
MVVAICSGRVKVCVTSAARAVVWLALYVCSMALALVRRHGRDRTVEQGQGRPMTVVRRKR